MKSLLYTGATGFLGKNTIPQLQRLGFNITTVGRKNANIIVDISHSCPKLIGVYDTVVHAAGKAHLAPLSKEDKNRFFGVNLQGTKNLCLSLEQTTIPQHFVFISTVAVYGLEEGINISENTPLLGTSPYAMSKIMAEQFLEEWCDKHNVKLSILRPSLIAGIDPPGNLGAMINGLQTGKYFRIADGSARKSVLMAIDIANLIPLLESYGGGIYNICDNYHPSFSELEDLICNQLKRPSPRSIPYPIAKIMALVGDLIGSKAPINSQKLSKIIKPLVFSNQKAKEQLGWKPMDVLQNFIIR